MTLEIDTNNLVFSPKEITKCDNLIQTGIYKIVNKENGRIYVGSTGDSFLARWKLHLSLLKRKAHHSIFLQNSFNKRGENAYSFEIIEFVEKEKILAREQYWIDTLNPDYNILKVAGSNLGFRHSKEGIEAMRLVFRHNRSSGRNKSGVNGVYYSERTKRWITDISLSWCRIPLGTFRLKERALLVRQEAEAKYWNLEFEALPKEEQKSIIEKDNLKRKVENYLYPDKDNTNTKYAGIILKKTGIFQVKLGQKPITTSYKTLEEAIIVRDKRYKELVGYQDDV